MSKSMKKNFCIFVPLLLILLLVFGQTSYLRSFVFKHYVTLKTWKEAQALCRTEGMDLMTVQSEQQIRLIQNIGAAGWIGLYRENETAPWKWSRGNETAASFEWGPREPNYLATEFCVIASSTGIWHNVNCHSVIGYYCYQENLVLVQENKTWEEALDHCRSLGMDTQNAGFDVNKHLYDLATFSTLGDCYYAQERAQVATTDEVWTGLRFLGDTWFWMGGEVVQNQDDTSCPAFSCGVLEKKTSTFASRACSEKKNFFCYKRP